MRALLACCRSMPSGCRRIRDRVSPRALGNAFQLTNILRDLKEDAALRRLYVPLDLLENHDIDAKSLDAVFLHPRFADVCAELAETRTGLLQRSRQIDKRTRIPKDATRRRHDGGVSRDAR